MFFLPFPRHHWLYHPTKGQTAVRWPGPGAKIGDGDSETLAEPLMLKSGPQALQEETSKHRQPWDD